MTFSQLWDSLLPIGRDPATGGYRRFSWTAEDAACREWFAETAAGRGMRTETDRNGNLWAWWGPDADGGGHHRPAPDAVTPPAAARTATLPLRPGAAVVMGSHLDSVPDGGAFDGPLGVVSAFAAIDLLNERGAVPRRPVAVAAFTEEEGARFGVACLGSRLASGAIEPDAARSLRDAAGTTLADAMAAAGQDPSLLGPDPGRLARIGAYVELHIEQGRALADLDAPVGVARRIWPHGRWRLEYTGQADHAGTALLTGRRDPMLPFAATVLAARDCAAARGAFATIGRVDAAPGAVNAVSASVRAWLDARAADDAALADLVEAITAAAQDRAARHQVDFACTPESVTPAVEFDPALSGGIADALAGRGMRAPLLATGAGHDAGILAAVLPTGMLFVRNPTGVSHSPQEHAEPADCESGVGALAAVLADLALR